MPHAALARYHAERKPDAIAVSDGRQSLTWAALEARAPTARRTRSSTPA
jgi:non-ribosomal peptide synthetase component E (peptide arylation enzyme)